MSLLRRNWPIFDLYVNFQILDEIAMSRVLLFMHYAFEERGVISFDVFRLITWSASANAVYYAVRTLIKDYSLVHEHWHHPDIEAIVSQLLEDAYVTEHVAYGVRTVMQAVAGAA